MEKIEKKITIFRWLCNECNKIIESQYIDQFEYNKKQHQLMHRKKEAKREIEKGGNK